MPKKKVAVDLESRRLWAPTAEGLKRACNPYWWRVHTATAPRPRVTEPRPAFQPTLVWASKIEADITRAGDALSQKQTGARVDHHYTIVATDGQAALVSRMRTRLVDSDKHYHGWVLPVPQDAASLDLVAWGDQPARTVTRMTAVAGKPKRERKCLKVGMSADFQRLVFKASDPDCPGFEASEVIPVPPTEGIDHQWEGQVDAEWLRRGLLIDSGSLIYPTPAQVAEGCKVINIRSACGNWVLILAVTHGW